MPNQILLSITLLFSVFNLNAQEKSNIKLKIETGFLPVSHSEKLGLFLNVEPKLKFSENSVIGLRFGISINTQTIENNDSSQFTFDNTSDNGVASFVPTFDYYLNESLLHPYLGIGIGFHLLGSYIDVSRRFVTNPSEDVFELNAKKKVGLLLRGGIDLNRFIVGLEYNLALKADIELPSGQAIGTVDYSYLGLTIGYEFGGQKNSN